MGGTNSTLQCWVTRWPKSTTRSPPTSLEVLSWQQNWRCWEQDGHRSAVDGEGALTRGRQSGRCVPAKALVCPLQIRVFRCTHLVPQDQKLLSRGQRRNHGGYPAASAAQPLSPVAEGQSEPQGFRPPTRRGPASVRIRVGTAGVPLMPQLMATAGWLSAPSSPSWGSGASDSCGDVRGESALSKQGRSHRLAFIVLSLCLAPQTNFYF